MGLKIYSNIVANLSKHKQFSVRKSIVLEALEEGIKPTALRFNMSRNTVRTWVKRFRSEGNDGLMDRRNGPNKIPHKTSTEEEDHIVEIRGVASCYGAKRLKYEFQLKPSIRAIQRILRSRQSNSFSVNSDFLLLFSSQFIRFSNSGLATDSCLNIAFQLPNLRGFRLSHRSPTGALMRGLEIIQPLLFAA